MLDYRNHRLTYSNAGHNYPFHFTQAGEPERLAVGGLVLGIVEGFSYREEAFDFRPGDSLLVFSDGISESTNADEEEFGEERIARLLLENRDQPAAEIINAIIKSVRAYSGESAQMDDMTLLVIKRVE